MKYIMVTHHVEDWSTRPRANYNVGLLKNGLTFNNLREHTETIFISRSTNRAWKGKVWGFSLENCERIVFSGTDSYKQEYQRINFNVQTENQIPYPQEYNAYASAWYEDDTISVIDDTPTTAVPFFSQIVSVLRETPFRERFKATYRTNDGHFVRSKAEMTIDNWLYQYGLVHAYERKLPISEDLYCDFFIPAGRNRPREVYLEYWGLENDNQYLERKQRKIEIYQRERLSLIELTEKDIQNLDDILPQKLLQYQITVT